MSSRLNAGMEVGCKIPSFQCRGLQPCYVTLALAGGEGGGVRGAPVSSSVKKKRGSSSFPIFDLGVGWAWRACPCRLPTVYRFCSLLHSQPLQSSSRSEEGKQLSLSAP